MDTQHVEVPKNDQVLVVCGQGPGLEGPLLAVEMNSRAAPEKIDGLGSFITIVDGRLYRVLSPPIDPPGTADLLIYDTTGVVAYHRLDGLVDVHGIVWDGSRFAIPCSATNEIVWIDKHGERVKTWRAPGENDSWHVNGVWFNDGRWYASAFGQCATKKELAERIFKEETPGVVFDVEAGNAIVSGLSCPHDPLLIDDVWLVCNSRDRQLLRIDPASGGRLDAIDLAGWTRGVAVSEDCIFVGESAERHAEGEKGRASVAVIDRRTFKLIRRINLPCVEVNTLCLVPRSFMPALRRGFRTNDSRTAILDRLSMFMSAGSMHPDLDWTRMEPLQQSECWIEIEALAPQAVGAATSVSIPLRITNLGRKTLLSAVPNPVYACYQWRLLDRPNNPSVEGVRSVLSTPILPDNTVAMTLSIQTPVFGGRYELLITLVQEWVRWFHEANSTNAARVEILIEGPSASSPQVSSNGKSAVGESAKT